MGTFSTYSMAGIGIAAAIGFVFALTVLSNSAVNPELADDNQLEDSLPSPSSSSSSQQKREAGEEEEDQSAQLMMEQDANNNNSNNNNNNLRPTLTSIVVLDANTGEVIGELEPEMQFKVNEQVLIQANFVSQDKVTDHLITLAIRSNTAEEATTDDNNNNNSDSDDSSSQMTSLLEEQQQQAVNLRGDIGPDSNIKIELYWSPSNVGEYTVTLYSTTPEEREASAQSSAVVIVEPIVEVSLGVV